MLARFFFFMTYARYDRRHRDDANHAASFDGMLASAAGLSMASLRGLSPNRIVPGDL